MNNIGQWLDEQIELGNIKLNVVMNEKTQEKITVTGFNQKLVFDILGDMPNYAAILESIYNAFNA